MKEKKAAKKTSTKKAAKKTSATPHPEAMDSESTEVAPVKKKRVKTSEEEERDRLIKHCQNQQEYQKEMGVHNAHKEG